VLGADAAPLFPLIYQTRVTDTIAWDGPVSLEAYTAALTELEMQTRNGEEFLYTIVERASGTPIGTCSVRPSDNKFRGDCGLWIGEPYHGKGFGTQVVREMMRIAFEQLGMKKLEASVYAGNVPSRRIFEKNGFQLEGTIRNATLKRGKLIDDWLLGITDDDYRRIGK
jgi:ribosomal-protein-alanine N-acetyltransferase